MGEEPHLIVVGFLSHVTSHNHAFRCSVSIPDSPPDLPVRRPHTSAVISSLLDGSLGIATG